MQKIFKVKLLKVLSTIILLCFAITSNSSLLFAKSKKMKVAVLNFENTTKESKYDYLSADIAESISIFLIEYANKKIKIVERKQLDKAVDELVLQQSGFTDEKNAVQVGKLTNATHIIIGSYTVIENTIRINARLISVKTAQGILAESVIGKGGKETFNQVNKLSAKIVESLTGKKVKFQEFNDIENPFQITVTIPKKKNSIIWLVVAPFRVRVFTME